MPSLEIYPDDPEPRMLALTGMYARQSVTLV